MDVDPSLLYDPRRLDEDGSDEEDEEEDDMRRWAVRFSGWRVDLEEHLQAHPQPTRRAV
jgi:hypothetical protein